MTNDVLRAALIARQRKDGSMAAGSPAKPASLSASSRMAQAAAQQQLKTRERTKRTPRGSERPSLPVHLCLEAACSYGHMCMQPKAAVFEQIDSNRDGVIDRNVSFEV